MASLFYDTLGNIAFYDTSGNGPQAGWGLANSGPFTNIQTITTYWYSTEESPNSAWGMDFRDG